VHGAVGVPFRDHPQDVIVAVLGGQLGAEALGEGADGNGFATGGGLGRARRRVYSARRSAVELDDAIALGAITTRGSPTATKPWVPG